ncbi:MAG: hypothetical protein ACLR20_08110 [Bifidobacterium longum]
MVLSAVAAAAVMLFGNAPNERPWGQRGKRSGIGGLLPTFPIALLCIVVLFSVRDGLLENTSNRCGVVPDDSCRTRWR